ncbi:NADP-dependent oxidoreductase domain-containing protein 1 [Mobula hypostoma]|uniref:NADP-dependent oxidoreductase domain-containing protein 1 n=1 Tax=Mobula hypostoma TaxID=723540 RepID=UPI002FC2B546
MAGSGHLDLLHGLPSLRFEAPLSEGEKKFSKMVRVRAWAHTACSCAHAAFYCSLLTAVRCHVLENTCFPHSWMAKFQILQSNSGCLRIGILGEGHLVKQLVLVLTQHGNVAPMHITISTKRPETLEELMDLGVHCIYDNQQLAASVDVLFLCCQLFQLTLVSSQIRGHISKTCIVYSLVTAVPAKRLQNLLGHSNIVRPQYIIQKDPWLYLWEKYRTVVEGLLVQEVVEETSPFKWKSQKCVKAKWFEEVLYSVLNVCNFLKVPHLSTLRILNNLLFGVTQSLEALHDPDLFVCESFITESCAESLSHNSPFPWIDLPSVSTQPTPLTKFFSIHPRLQGHFSFVYRMKMLKKTNKLDDDGCCRLRTSEERWTMDWN